MQYYVLSAIPTYHLAAELAEVPGVIVLEQTSEYVLIECQDIESLSNDHTLLYADSSDNLIAQL